MARHIAYHYKQELAMGLRCSGVHCYVSGWLRNRLVFAIHGSDKPFAGIHAVKLLFLEGTAERLSPIANVPFL